ncbi:tyrosine-type recombinase/integrase [Microbacterium panaciterrae]|uniref:Tyrosine-type recombinase/integrase n=1 Tax=Microbacterium panaciterrae TaxID=985759 RepID=A0ABP8P5D8_9MICO
MTKHTDHFYRYLREWFTVFLPHQRGASLHTIIAFRDAWNLLLRYVTDTRQIPLEQITFSVIDRELVSEFLDHMTTTRGWSASTRNQRLACIRSFFRYAASAEPTLAMHLAAVAMIPQKKQRAGTAIRYLTAAAVTTLLATPDPLTRTGLRDQFFMILMYDLAARDAEMLTLTVGAIDAKRRTAELIGKGAKPRRLPITAETAEHYRRYAGAFHPGSEPGDPLFYTTHNHRKTPMSDDNVARFLHQYAATAHQANVEVPERVHPHMLRHSRAMHLYQAGMPLEMLTEWLGHADPETTLIYAHADTEMKRDALAKITIDIGTDPARIPIWRDREDIIQRLCGLAS